MEEGDIAVGRRSPEERYGTSPAPSDDAPADASQAIGGGDWTDKARALQILVDIVKHNLGWLVVLMALTAFSAFGYKLYLNLDSILERVFPVHDFHVNLKADHQIQKALTKTREYTNADRLIVTQYHNGVVGDGKLPFRKYSATYAETAPGIAYNAEGYQGVPLSMISEFNVDIYADDGPKCIVRTLDEIESNVIKERWKERGVDMAYMCPIMSLDGTPIGGITSSFLSRGKSRPADEAIFKEMQTLALQVSGYLQTSVLNKK